MKIASLLSYVATGALAALISSLLGGSYATAAYVAFTTSLLALIAVREYTPRSRFVVTAKQPVRGRFVTIRRSPRRVARFNQRSVVLAR